MMKLKGKVAVVTGAGSGNGRAIALEFAKEGAKVALVDITKENADKTLEMVKVENGEGISLVADVSNSKEIKNAIDTTIETYGRIDIMVNNAGIADAEKTYQTTDEDAFDKVLNINLKGVFLGTKFVLDNMIKNKSGVIINTASIAGIRGGLASPAYTASKHGVIGLTGDTASKHGKDGIRAIAICPGIIETNMTKNMIDNPNDGIKQLINSIPIGGLGKPQDIGKLALFLASDDARYITGSHIVIDGGLTTS